MSVRFRSPWEPGSTQSQGGRRRGLTGLSTGVLTGIAIAGDPRQVVRVKPAEHLATRHGVFMAAEARTFGIRQRRGGKWDAHRMIGSVYSVLPAPWTAEARWTAGVLAGGPGALLFGDSWLEALGLESVSPTRIVHVLTPAAAGRSSSTFAHFTRTRQPLAAGYGVRQQLVRPLAADIGLAAAPLMVAHLATYFPAGEVRATLATTVQKRLTTVEEVATWAAGHPRSPGAKVAAWAAGELAGGLQSEGEVRFHTLARAVGMPPDAAQVDIWSGRTRVSTTDAFWEAGVAGYYDGVLHMLHATHKRDIAIRERLRTAGLLVAEVTSDTLNDRASFAQALAARLDQAREAASARHWTRSDRGIELGAGF